MTRDATPPPTPPTPPTPPRRPHRWGRWFAGTVVAPLLIVALAAALLGWALTNERGSRWLWQTAVSVMDGKLTGEWRGGTFAHGIRVDDVRYLDGATRITVSHLDGRWQLGMQPWHLNVDRLHAGDVEIVLPPSPPTTTPTKLPESLTLPLGLTLGDIRVTKLTLHTPDLVLQDVRLSGRSDGRDHTLLLDRVATPYGDVNANLKLSGLRPFVLGGDLGLRGTAGKMPVQVQARLTGSLEALGVTLDATGEKLNGHAVVDAAPFAEVPLKRAQISVDHLNPREFAPSAPIADVSVQADLRPVPDAATFRVSGPLTVINAAPGAIDAARVPVSSLRAQVELDAQRQALASLDVRLARRAVLTGSGEVRRVAVKNAASGEATEAMAGAFALAVRDLDLRELHGKLPATALAGPLDVTLDASGQRIVMDWRDAARRMRADVTLNADGTTIHALSLDAGAGQVAATGSLGNGEKGPYRAQIELTRFDPAAWYDLYGPQKKGAKLPLASVTGQLDAEGELRPELRLALKFALHDSAYANLPMSGGGMLRLAGSRMMPSDASLLVAGNRVVLKGSFGAAGDKLSVNVDAPALDKLGFGLSGLLKLDGQLAGTIERPTAVANVRAESLAFGEQKLAHLSGKLDISGGLHGQPQDRLNATLDGTGFSSPAVTLDRVNVALAGTRGAHTLKLLAHGKVRQAALGVSVAAAGAMTDTRAGVGWRGTVQTLENSGSARLHLAAPWQVEASGEHIHLGAATLTTAAGTLVLANFDYGAGQMRSAGALQALDVGQILSVVGTLTGETPSVASDLVLDGRWNVQLGQRADGFVEVVRRSGDVSLPRGGVNPHVNVTVTGIPGLTTERGAISRIALGLSDLKARLELSGNTAKATVRAASGLAGTLDADAATTLKLDNGLPRVPDDAPLSGRIAMAVPDLSKLGTLAGAQYAFKGRAKLQMTLAGTVGRPRPTGELTGDGLSVAMFDTGIGLNDGRVRVALSPDAIDLRDVVFTGGAGGTLRATGRIRLDTPEPAMDVSIVADKLQLFAAPDRELVLTGQAKAAGSGETLAVTGKFTVDRARFDMPPASAPKLGDDVLVVRGGATARGAPVKATEEAARIGARPAGRFSPRIDIEIDLGRDFRFKGAGADLLLRGSLRLQGEPLTPLRAVGTIKVAEGTYEAFDRKLAIDRGLINFQGPLDNPDIYIQAMRRNQDVAAGVLVTGTIRQLRVALVSEPNVSDEEKLSWLLFGHGPDSAGLGQRQAMAGAAVALLGATGGRKVIKDLGIDEFGIGTSDSGLPDDQQVVKVGRALSDNFSLGAEQSLTSAATIVKLTWQASRRWQLVLRAGSLNGFDVLFNRRFD
ncbi:Translocation and assembly module TamB [Pandoraea terrae]|uniref:Translocation and assembly module TamB n=1 Tax=Pandoraea terrae TaxID=1537710 RepID=A0A5E4RM39_9BURK|nr:translocation/assembly module TamB domain-containing protein [Pandoraea terrae]VVD63482.1 Translocation and assembly module TamB [Pandoraea terrae]